MSQLTPPPSRPTAVLVIGMHRSGTSAVARTINLMGADLSPRLMLAGPDNPTGFWESPDIMAAHDRFLKDVGSAWDDPRPLPTGVFIGGAARRLQDDLLAVLHRDFSDTSCFVVKDPRMARLLPVWRSALSLFGAIPVAVLPVRNPLDVAMSLRLRNGMARDKALALWLGHVLAGEHDSRGWRRVFVDYDRFLADPQEQTRRLSMGLECFDPARVDMASADIEAFWTESLRHHRFAIGNSGGLALPRWVQQAYQWVMRAVQDEAEPSGDVLDRLRDSLAGMSDLFGSLITAPATAQADDQALDANVHLTNALVREAQARAEAESRVQEKTTALQQRDQDIAALRLDLDCLRQQMAEMAETSRRDRAETGWRAAELDRLRRDQAVAASTLAERVRAELSNEQGAWRSEAEAMRSALTNERSAWISAVEGLSESVSHSVAAVLAETRRTEPVMSEAMSWTVRRADQAVAALAVMMGDLSGYVPPQRRIGGWLKAALRGRLRQRLCEDRDIAVIARSHLFDAVFYLGQYPDVAVKRVDPLVHYVRSGAAEGRNPHPLFDTRFYLDAYPDVARAGMNPLAHYARFGRPEGRRPHPRVGRGDEFSLSSLMAFRLFGSCPPPPALLAEQTDPAPTMPVAAGLFHGATLPPLSFADLPTEPAMRDGWDTMWPQPVEPPIAPDDRVAARQMPSARRLTLDLPLVPPDVARQLDGIADRYGLHTPDQPWAGESAALLDLVKHLPLPPETLAETPPVLSILVPVGESLRHCLAVLDCLARWPSRYASEILLVGTASAFLKRFQGVPGIRTVETPLGVSPVAALGQAAEQAQGQFLLFLDPTTFPLAGTIDGLLTALNDHGDCPLVTGCRLLPDGRMWDAGGHVWADGALAGYGRLDDPRRSSYRHGRSLDWVTPGLMAVTADCWRAAGGFDPAFSSVDYAAADLAFRVRSGRQPARVWYEPDAVAVAWVPQTVPDSGSQTDRKLFLDRWAAALAPEGGAAAASLLEHDRIGRLLWLDAVLPTPGRDSGSDDVMIALRLLREQGWHVSFAPMEAAADEADTRLLRRMGIECPSSRRDESWIGMASRLAAGVDVVVVSRLAVAHAVVPVLRAAECPAKIVFNTTDLHFLRESREAEILGDSVLSRRARETRTDELAAIRASDATLVVSRYERDLLAELTPSARVWVMPVRRDPPAGPFASFAQRQGIVFVGGFRHRPNLDGMQWFLSEIWPKARAMGLTEPLYIVGADVPPSLAAGAEDVHILGPVDNLASVLNRCRISIAPLRYGAGAKGKVVDSLMQGVPVVATPIAAEGMGLEDGRHITVAADADAFARAVVDLCQDEERWKRLSAIGGGFARFTFSSETAGLVLRDALADLLPKPSASRPSALVAAGFCPANDAGRTESQTDVDVSVIVPVYNGWSFTQACLTSVLKANRDVSLRWELILADDGSTDETLNAAHHFPGIRVVRGEKNVGFLGNCNRAAAKARGRFLLLLNNDTTVRPGWMTSLVQMMEADPTVAIAGSKILYPNGTVQSAGGVLWQDGTAWICGRELAADAPEVSVAREIDYAPGASMMIRRTFWDQVDGFDPRFDNAYCEDSDLAMAARAKGLRVLYQPLSEVIHFEHGSYTEELANPRNALQAENTRRLVDKWREAFDWDHLPPDTAGPVGAAHAERRPLAAGHERRRQGRLNVLYFSPFPSHPNNHGNQATIQLFGRHFKALGHRVHFALLDSHMIDPDNARAMRQAWDSLTLLPYNRPLGGDGTPIAFDDWYEDGLGERIRRLCDLYDIDVVFCSYIFQSKLLEFVPAHILKVIDTHDKMGDRFAMMQAAGLKPEFFSCTAQEEGAYLNRADLVIARRQQEADYFDSVTGRATARVIAHVEDAEFLQRDFTGLRHVGVVASANRVNLGSVRDFLRGLDRRVGDGNCPFTIHIAGQVRDLIPQLTEDEQDLFTRPWVRLLGFVPDIDAFYAQMDVVASPVSLGTGINTKSVQAMAFGMPLITTECGSKGLETDEPLHHLADVDHLVDALLALAEQPDDLSRLAALSRECYGALHDRTIEAMRQMFAHPKLGGDKDAPICSWPFNFMEIHDVGVTPCCTAWLHKEAFDRLPMPQGDLMDMWNAPAMQAVRRSILDGSFSFCNPESCHRLHQGLERRTDILAGRHGKRLRMLVARQQVVLPPPTYYNLCNDRSCNLSCPYCREEMIYIGPNDPGYESRREVLDQAVEQINGTVRNVTVGATGSGDPFASKLMFDTLCKLDPVRNPGIGLILQTNGLLLDRVHWDRLSHVGQFRLVSVIISLDAACADTYSQNRRGGQWDKLVANLDFVESLVASGDVTDVRLDMVVLNNNYQEIPAFIDIARSRGFYALLQGIRNDGTYDDASFAEKNILSPDHPDHQDFCQVMQSLPAYDRLSLGNLTQWAKA